MKVRHLHTSLLIGCFFLIASAGRADEEADFISILKSNADVPAKCAACFQLRRAGTARSVPALASLLGQERVSHAACHALEGMPTPEAGAALRQALGAHAGLIKVGLIDALGGRAEPEAVPLLMPLLPDDNVAIAAAAATSLGRIGGVEAVAALTAFRAEAVSGVQASVFEALLHAAEGLDDEGRVAAAIKVYEGLFGGECPTHVRVAAWRGLAMTDAEGRVTLISNALSGTDRPIHRAALKLVRTGTHPQVLEACLGQWASLPADAQLALLDAHLTQGQVALPTVRLAMNSRHLSLRLAAWEALADVDDLVSIPTMVRAAAGGEAAEQKAARDSLSRLHGPGARAALLTHLDQADPREQAEVLRALGERGDRDAAPVLLQHAAAELESVRLAALESLRQLALPETLPPLLALAARPMSVTDRKPFMRTLYSVTQASPDRDQATRSVTDAFDRFPKEARHSLLPLLARLGTSAALTPVLNCLHGADAEDVKEALRALAQWPTAEPTPELLEFTRHAVTPTLQVLALRACIRVVAQEPDAALRLQVLEETLSLARRDEERKQVLGQVGRIPTRAALELAVGALANSHLSDEASLAALMIAEQLPGEQVALVEWTADQVLARSQRSDLLQRAWALRPPPSHTAGFIRKWWVCGPYRWSGAVGAQALFDVAFAPEASGADLAWQSTPRGDPLNLAAVFPHQEDCVAYLRTAVAVPADTRAVLLMGSDDGVKVWLNGEVVHRNSVDRGLVADQDMALLRMKKGNNELLVKVTQGAGGWAVTARIVGLDGLPLAGLRVLAEQP